MSDPHASAGEIGGIIAGVVALLGSFGAGIAWFAKWASGRETSRAVKLQKWHEEIDERERLLDAKIASWEEKLEKRVAHLEGQNRTLRLAFELVSAPLRVLDPANEAHARAEKLLEAAFPLDPLMPPDMGRALGAID